MANFAKRPAGPITRAFGADPSNLRHVRPVQPLLFPSSDPDWDMPESVRHRRLCELLYQILRHALGPEHSVGQDNFVYFDAAHPRRCLAPDGFVKLGFPRDVFDSWKIWERGTPELCVEILSPSDTKEKLPFAEKLRRYRALGTRELIAFNVGAKDGTRLRAWDRIDGDLVERVVERDTTPCVALGLHWVLAKGSDELSVALRLAQDPAGRELMLTSEEAEREARLAESAARVAQEQDLVAERAARVAEQDARAKQEVATAEALREIERLRKLLAVRGG